MIVSFAMLSKLSENARAVTAAGLVSGAALFYASADTLGNAYGSIRSNLQSQSGLVSSKKDTAGSANERVK